MERGGLGGVLRPLKELTEHLSKTTVAGSSTSTVTRGEVAVAILKVAELAEKVEKLQAKLEAVRQIAIARGDAETLAVLD